MSIRPNPRITGYDPGNASAITSSPPMRKCTRCAYNVLEIGEGRVRCEPMERPRREDKLD